MRQPSIRGIGIRYWIGLVLPITGIALVVYTVVMLIGAHAAGIPPASPHR